MLRNTFCPTLTKSSFISIITFVETVIFIGVTLASFFMGVNTHYFLGANRKIVDKLQRDPDRIVNDYEVWRLMTAVFIQTGFSHWIMNMVT